MAAQLRKRDADGGEIGGVERALHAASRDDDDAGEGWGRLEEGNEVGDEADSRIVVQCC